MFQCPVLSIFKFLSWFRDIPVYCITIQIHPTPECTTFHQKQTTRTRPINKKQSQNTRNKVISISIKSLQNQMFQTFSITLLRLPFFPVMHKYTQGWKTRTGKNNDSICNRIRGPLRDTTNRAAFHSSPSLPNWNYTFTAKLRNRSDNLVCYLNLIFQKLMCFFYL